MKALTMIHGFKTFACLFLVASFVSCESHLPFEGKVVDIERGKDGYNTTLVTSDGDTLTATVSRVNMDTAYLELEVGQSIELAGDTMMLDDKIHIKANKIKIK